MTMTDETARPYEGWEIRFGISTSESDYGQEPFAPEFDFDLSLRQLEHMEILAVQKAFPGAIVTTVWGLSPSHATETKAFGPSGTTRDDEEGVIETVNAILEQHFGDMPAWLIPSAIQNNDGLSPAARQLILDLCHEAGDEGTDEELIDGFLGNHNDIDILIEAAAGGDVLALLTLREACGLPLFR